MGQRPGPHLDAALVGQELEARLAHQRRDVDGRIARHGVAQRTGARPLHRRDAHVIERSQRVRRARVVRR